MTSVGVGVGAGAGGRKGWRSRRRALTLIVKRQRHGRADQRKPDSAEGKEGANSSSGCIIWCVPAADAFTAIFGPVSLSFLGSPGLLGCWFVETVGTRYVWSGWTNKTGGCTLDVANLQLSEGRWFGRKHAMQVQANAPISSFSSFWSGRMRFRNFVFRSDSAKGSPHFTVSPWAGTAGPTGPMSVGYLAQSGSLVPARPRLPNRKASPAHHPALGVLFN